MHVVTTFWKATSLTKWSHNLLRHCFASYLLAKNEDAPRFALDMGDASVRT